MFSLRPDVGAPPDADDGDNRDDAADNFLPFEDNDMELDQDPEQHVDRQASVLLLYLDSDFPS